MSTFLARIGARLRTSSRIAKGTAISVGLALLVFASISISLPDNEIRVVSFEPTGTVDLLTNITIKFSKPMVSMDMLDQPVLDPPVIFTPPIRGIARWVEGDVLRFFPDAELKPATAYTAKVQSDRTWISGLKIVSNEIYRFVTPTLRLVSSDYYSERDVDKPGYARAHGRLVFNYPVSLDELRSSFSIKGAKDAVKGSLQFTVRPSSEETEGEQAPAVNAPASTNTQPTYGTAFEFISESVPQAKAFQRYTITIAKDLPCQNCSLPLQEPIVLTVDIEPVRPLVVESVVSSNEGDLVSIHINFSLPVSIDEARQYISIEPKIDYVVDGNYTEAILRGSFKPGETYTISVAKGLNSQAGSALERDFSTRLQIADLQPSISFTSHGVFLPRGGNGLLEVKTVNVGKVEVEIEQVFANNLAYFLMTGYGGYESAYWDNRASMLGRSLFIKDKALDYVQNEPLLTTIDVKGIAGEQAKGIFKVSVRNKEERWTGDARYAMLTDIGISARFGDNYLMVWTNSLSGSQPIAGATISLISRNNQILVQGKTDGRGIAVFENIKDKLSGFEPFVITAEREGDLSYLRLDETLLPTSDFDVSGRPFVESGYDAFLYTDRGVYRPGDTVHVVSMVRGANASLPPSFPYFLTVYDTRGKKFTSYRMTTEGAGMVSLDIVIPDYATTGRYSIAAMIGEDLQIGRTDFLVEEFMPDRIKVTLTTPETSYKAGDTVTAAVDAKLLFGPPASGYQVSARVSIEPAEFSPAGYSGYIFVDHERTFNRMDVTLRDTVLNDTGGYTYEYEIPKNLSAPSMLKGLFAVAVSEQGGRSVGAYKELLIHPYARYVGVKLAAEGYAKPGEAVEAHLIALDPDGKPVELPRCDVRFYRVVYNSLLKKDKAGFYRWVSERKRIVLDSTTVALPASGATVSFVPPDYGSYEMAAQDREGGHSSAAEFYASGWGYAPWALNNPDKIELGLDKQSYTAGDKAKLQVRAPFGGKLFVTIEQTGVYEIITRDMADNTAEIEIPVKKEYLPNAYITAAVIRSADSLQPNMPARAFGLIPLVVSNAEKRLGITVTAPQVMKPKAPVTIDLQLDHPGVSEVTVAAVDAGILQLTDFKTPDPLDYFFGKKQPYLKPYDLYSFLYPQVKQAKSHLSPSGDKMFAASRLRHLNPFTSRRVKSVALWSGVLKTDNSGKASVTFNVPEFNGRLLIMAVASQQDRFGSAAKELTVRDRIVVQESFPRFISPNDIFDGLVTLFNNTGAKANITVSLAINGPVDFAGPSTVTVSIDNNREGAAVFKLKALQAPGTVSFKITAKSGEETAELSLELPNRPALPLVTSYGSGVVSKAVPAAFTFPGNWLPTTDQYVLQTSSMPAVSFKRNIQYLLQYPYGCIEQTTSRLFPLLYYNDLVKIVEPSLVGSQGADYFIQEGIVKLQSMQLPDRTFAFWPGGTTSNNFTSIYVAHFLSEANKAGYQVDKKTLEQVYSLLNDMALGRNLPYLTESHRVYAAYVLAQAGKLEQRVVSYLKKVDPKGLDAYARFQLAGALALSGDMADATKLIPLDVQPNLFEPETGGDFNSGTRTDAILLEILLQITPGNPSIDVLARSLMERAQTGRWYTTQENAWGLMALGKYFRNKSGAGFAGTIAIEGDQQYPFDSTGFKVTRSDLGGKKISLAVTAGDGTGFFYWQASGIPSTNVTPEFDKGIRIRRQYLDEDAKPANLKTVRLGDRLICAISVDALEKPLYNVVISDLLPAGFEIENPRLKTTPRLSWIPQEGAPIDYQDIRDDRLLIFANIFPGAQAKYYYSLRAICAGSFKVPPITAECMYNPLIASSASSGAVNITK